MGKDAKIKAARRSEAVEATLLADLNAAMKTKAEAEVALEATAEYRAFVAASQSVQHALKALCVRHDIDPRRGDDFDLTTGAITRGGKAA